MNNRKFEQHYANPIAYITDGLLHRQAISILKTKAAARLIDEAAVVGYRDCVAGFYDKFWRYQTKQELFYLHGVQAAINNGASIEAYIELDFSRSESVHVPDKI